jgi:hypothetical protein
MRYFLDGTIPFPNLILDDRMEKGTVRIVTPGEYFDFITPEGETKRVEWKPRQVVEIRNLQVPE